ncbi:MAG: LPS export ABC transporter ATP-binding protein [Planctomycetia bacterium]|nr:LPS export ABC transporter ATP-binding protein [Planctomycetia bacterium]
MLNTSSLTDRDIVLETSGLVKKYGPRTVVKGVSFRVHEGEVVGLLGANGAGKTTSFRMTCGLIPANEGKVWLGSVDVTDWPMYRRAKEGKMGYLPQDRSVFGALTTEKNLYIMMEMLGMGWAEQKRKCAELLEKFHLEKVRHTVVGQGGTGGLSGGERRRLEIARALLSNPKVLLLDEPFANVDPLTVKEIQNVIRDLSEEGIAVLITDHQVDETLEITHRSYVIDDGQVLCSGTPLEVLSNEEARKRYFGDKTLPPGMPPVAPTPTSASRRADRSKVTPMTRTGYDLNNVTAERVDSPAPALPRTLESSAERPSAPSGWGFFRRAKAAKTHDGDESCQTGESRGGYTVPESRVFPAGEFRVERPARKGIFDEYADDSELVTGESRKKRSLTLNRKAPDQHKYPSK